MGDYIAEKTSESLRFFEPDIHTPEQVPQIVP